MFTLRPRSSKSSRISSRMIGRSSSMSRKVGAANSSPRMSMATATSRGPQGHVVQRIVAPGLGVERPAQLLDGPVERERGRVSAPSPGTACARRSGESPLVRGRLVARAGPHVHRHHRRVQVGRLHRATGAGRWAADRGTPDKALGATVTSRGRPGFTAEDRGRHEASAGTSSGRHEGYVLPISSGRFRSAVLPSPQSALMRHGSAPVHLAGGQCRRIRTISPEVSRGVLRAHREGIVTSTSVLGNCPDPAEVQGPARPRRPGWAWACS